MRIITETRLKQFLAADRKQAKAEKAVKLWIMTTKAAAWKNPADMKTTFGHTVDFVKSQKGSNLTVFDIHNNGYRMITAVHLVKKNPIRGRVYVLQILTHEDYDTEKWKQEL